MFCTVVIIFSSWPNFYLNYNFTIKYFLTPPIVFVNEQNFT